ncbi:MAG: hypothetical protein H0V89_09220, partial [Deltaproteobacteria bacterium]|nr:hypothetical protein [Deltaproteobacteria bacterium]
GPAGFGTPVDLAVDLGGGVVVTDGVAVAVSRDGGDTWTLGGSPGDVLSVAVAPGLVLAGGVGGLMLSEDDGLLWTPLPAFLPEVGEIGIAPGWPADLDLAVASPTQALFLSNDSGGSFLYSPVPLPSSDQSPEVHFDDIEFSTRYGTDGRVAVGAFEGLVLSADEGATWVESDTRPPSLVTGVALSPSYAEDSTLIVTTYDSSTYLSQDGGDTFATMAPGLPTSSSYDGVLVEGPDGRITAILAHLGSVAIAPVGEPWTLWPYVSGTYPTVLAASPAFATDGVVIMGTREDGVLRSADFGHTWAFVGPDRQKISSLAFAPGGDAWAGTASGGVFRSTDGGSSWSGVPVDVAVGPSFVAATADRVWAGTSTGVWASDDGGVSFDRVVAASLPPGPVDQLVTAEDGSVYASIRGSGVYHSADGLTFAQVRSGATPVFEIARSPAFAADGILVVASDSAVERIVDGGTPESIAPDPIRYEEITQAIDAVPGLATPGDPLASAQSYALLEAPDDVLSLNFAGEAVEIWGPTFSDGGTADLTLDGVAVGELTCLGAPASGVNLWSSGLLPPGDHVITVTPRGDGPVGIDAFDVHATFSVGGPGDTDTGPGDTDTEDPDDTDDLPQPDTGGDDGKNCGCAHADPSPLALGLLLALALRRRRSAPRQR